ncbi:hypothetical protein NIES267_40150 [Calothrix parasitica NIES-267]|uniref:Uncharacterized protein n=1 Tax=Calothrix parasitica NIES-267 TaxID=1973488 RepID=A0A1Z4LTG1_9CYAN|nr:hypothetical protein NIES267_40150 [Calothrix parasitica NIES-267]
MFVRITFWLVLVLFFADIAQPGYFKFWQPNLTELSSIDIRLPNLHFNKNKSTTKISPSEASTCDPPDNDLEEVLQAKFGCQNATPH